MAHILIIISYQTQFDSWSQHVCVICIQIAHGVTLRVSAVLQQKRHLIVLFAAYTVGTNMIVTAWT